MYVEYSSNIEILLTKGTDGQLLAVIFGLVLRNTLNYRKGVGQSE